MGNQLSSGKVAAAFTVAVLADCIQLPVNVLMLTGVLAVPSEAFDILVDMGAFAITVALLGFNWVLLPTAFVEMVPLLDAFPFGDYRRCDWRECRERLRQFFAGARL